MTEPTAPVKKLEWTWVWISFASYILFYILPLVIAGQANVRPGLQNVGQILIAVWVFAGIIFVAAVVAYNSKGVTLWEPAIAGLLVAVLLFAYRAVTVFSHLRDVRWSLFAAIVEPILWLAAVFALSLFGAWWGERAQKLWKKTPEEEAKSALIATGQKGLTRSGMILGIIGTVVTSLVIIAVGVSLFRAQSVVSNKDALINDLNNLAAFSYQYRIRPSSNGGGNGAYTGLKMPEKFGTRKYGTFTFTVIGPDEVRIKAVSQTVEGAAIETTLDGDGRLGNWTYFGNFM